MSEATLQELREDLEAEIASSSVQGFWTAAMKNKWLNKAGRKICSFYRWPFLELSVYTTTRDQKEYYTYPTGALRFKPNSIYQIAVADEEYPPGQAGRGRVTWEEFTKLKQDEADQKVFANHNGFYFLYPVPEDGKEMQLFGLKGWQELASDTDKPVTPDEFDEAIVQLAKASALRKAKRYKEAQAEMVEVLDPVVGTLALLKSDTEVENAGGYGGQAVSSRFG